MRVPAAAILCALSVAALGAAPPAAPEYGETYLMCAYPAGGQRGQTLSVELRAAERSIQGKQLSGLKDALGLIIDGPPGIAISKVENVSDTLVRAELTIAPDAPLGRRMVRVRSARTGLTNFTYFVVGALPEVLESKANNELSTAQRIETPVVANGRIEGALDVDSFRFSARKGERIVCCVSAHAIDSRVQTPRSFIDAALELVDAEGRVVADAADTLGLDPMVEYVPQADGEYTARVKLVNYLGYPEAVYRLTIGATPLSTSVLPVAIERGKTEELSFAGVNLPPAARSAVSIPATFNMPVLMVAPPDFGANELPLLATDVPEAIEREPNDERAQAMSLTFPAGVSGQFLADDAADWYRVPAKKGQALRVEIHAQRYLRSPVDTLVEVFDAAGNPLQSNDDLSTTEVEMLHDFDPFDSLAIVKAPADGDVHIRVSEQTGTRGPRAVYHLTVSEQRPDVRLHVWPDAVPVWGPGSTAGFVVTLDRIGFKPEVELSVEGLPPGWTGSTSVSSSDSPNMRAFLTLTAPPDAKLGDVAEFRVLGRWQANGQTVTREAQPLTAYMPNDRHICRVSPKLRAAVAMDLGLRMTSETRELNVVAGETAEAIVRVTPADLDQLTVSVNLAGNSFRCDLGVQQKLPVAKGLVSVPIPCSKLAPGRYGIIVSHAWVSELRKGLPGPCTSVIPLVIKAPGEKVALK